jgi:hypothetical protein
MINNYCRYICSLLAILSLLVGCKTDGKKLQQDMGVKVFSDNVSNDSSPIVVTPLNFDFGSLDLNETKSKIFTVTNNSNESTRVLEVSLQGQQYQLLNNNCSSKNLRFKDVCTFEVSFSPQTSGLSVAVITIAYSGPSKGNQTISVSGVGDIAQPELTFSPSVYNFGNVATNISSNHAFTLANNSSITAYLGVLTIQGNGFSIANTNCNNIILTSGGSCQVTVSFSPLLEGIVSSVLTAPFSSSLGSSYQTQLNVAGTGVSPAVAFSFDGFSSTPADFSDLSPTGAVLHWTPQPAAAYYKLWLISGGATLVATINDTTVDSFTLNGLIANTTYVYRINAYDITDVTEGNSNFATLTTPNATGATFNGWNDVVSEGEVFTEIASVDDNLGLTGLGRLSNNLYTSVPGSGIMENAVVKIAWDAFTITPASIPDNYMVERSSDGINFVDITLNGSLNIGSRIFTDPNVAMEETYYYRITPIVGVALPVAPSSDRVIKVYVPPRNMVFMHRWIANREFCEKVLSKSWPNDFNRADHYACNYSWGKTNDGLNHLFAPLIPLNALDAVHNPDPAGYNRNKEKWDLGYSLIIDKFEAGCKVSGHALPTKDVPVGGADGDVAYRGGGGLGRTSGAAGAGLCYRKIGSVWSNSGSFTENVLTNMPGYPPVRSTRLSAYNRCQGRVISGVGQLRPWRLTDAIMAKAWQGTVRNPSNGLVNLYDAGQMHSANGACNTNTDTQDLVSTDIQLKFIDWTRVFITGSNATRNCVSRYGLHDAIGNVREWTTELVSSCSAKNGTTEIVPDIDSENFFSSGFVEDGTVGFTLTANDPSYSIASNIYPFLGLRAPSNTLFNGSITIPSALRTADLYYRRTEDGSSICGMSIDGQLYNGSRNGRFSSIMLEHNLQRGYGTSTNLSISMRDMNGFRCMGEINL